MKRASILKERVHPAPFTILLCTRPTHNMRIDRIPLSRRRRRRRRRRHLSQNVRQARRSKVKAKAERGMRDGEQKGCWAGGWCGMEHQGEKAAVNMTGPKMRFLFSVGARASLPAVSTRRECPLPAIKDAHRQEGIGSGPNQIPNGLIRQRERRERSDREVIASTSQTESSRAAAERIGIGIGID